MISPLTYLVSPFIHPLLAKLMNGVPLEKGLPKPSGPPPVWSSTQAGRKTLPLSKSTAKTAKTAETAETANTPSWWCS